MKKKFLHFAVLSAITLAGYEKASAQGAGTLSGDLMFNGNFFQRDSAIGAESDLYNKYLSGSEGWLSLRYSNYGFTGYLRVDVFNNSNLQKPLEAMSGFGIGAWSISKEVKGLTITGGYIYDQIGSGILFRSYEDRGLLIDNALEGLHLKYKLGEHLTVKAFTGQQKNVFNRFQPIIKGFNAEGDYSLSKNVHLNPGFGVLNRTLDNASYTAVFNNIQSMPAEQQFTPRYNMYAFTAYNTLSAGDFTWYLEGAYKTREAINDYNVNLIDKPGNVVFTTLGYAKKGIARYTPASQDLSEVAANGNMLLSPSEAYDFNLSYTHINTLDNVELYREAYFEANIRSVKNMLIDFGAQYMHYNKGYYTFETGVPIIKAFTPFAEITYLFSSTKSLKLQAQYMQTKQDDGSWAFLSLEYAMAPKWSFALSDMYNVTPEGTKRYEGQHFYNIFIARTQGAHRISLAYVKQVEGINCTGGVCRYEPGFSGLKVSITSSF